MNKNLGNENRKRNEDDNEAYHAFLLRCWREGDQWRFTLESIGEDRKQHGFASLEMMVAFLQRHLALENENA